MNDEPHRPPSGPRFCPYKGNLQSKSIRLDKAKRDGAGTAGKAILRDYIKATVGFEKLGEATGTQPKSLIRMFGPRGNPQARNLFGVIGYLQKQDGVELDVTQGPG